MSGIQQDETTIIAQSSRPRIRWQPWALATICLLAALLYVWNIASGSYGNSFYSAAVKSMSHNFTNFLFGSYDPYGVVTVDKPPMAFWPQVLSVRIFGFHGWSLLLPQVLEGVGAVFVLHRTVRRWAGENVALLAALLLALTPIVVAINRDNNPDTLLALWLVLAAYAFTRSVGHDNPRGRTKWLLWCAFFIGCGFVTKMMEAWILVPGVALAYLFGTAAPVRRRILDLLGAGLVLLVSSFWWSALHDLWPGTKPYMGGSTDGTALNLIFGYNGLGRILGEGHGGGAHGGPPAGAPPAGGRGGGFGGMMGGNTGLTRMFGAQVGTQVSWLLPLALLVLVFVAIAGVRRIRAKLPAGEMQRSMWLMWSGWLVITMLVFSYAQGIWHPYYTNTLAPPIAAVSAAGIAAAWRRYRTATDLSWLLLPLAIAVTAVWAFVLVSRDPSWQGWIREAVVVCAILAIAGLVLGKLAGRRVLARPALVLGLVSALLAPTVWCVATAAENNISGAMPTAGPASSAFGGRARQLPADRIREMARFAGGRGSAQLTAQQRQLLDYVRKNDDGAAITLAVEGGSMTTSPFIIGSDDMVIGMGGFSGTDDVPTVSQLQQWVSTGKLRFVLGGDTRGGMRGFGGSASAERQRESWVSVHCQTVPPAAYGGDGTQALYHCG